MAIYSFIKALLIKYYSFIKVNKLADLNKQVDPALMCASHHLWYRAFLFRLGFTPQECQARKLSELESSTSTLASETAIQNLWVSVVTVWKAFPWRCTRWSLHVCAACELLRYLCLFSNCIVLYNEFVASRDVPWLVFCTPVLKLYKRETRKKK